MKPLKVLHIGADNIGYGGRSVIAFNLTQHMDENIVANDFLVFHKVTEKKYIDALKSKCGKYVQVNINAKAFKLLREVTRTKQIVRIIKKESYDIIHIHADNAYEAMKSVWIGKLAGLRKFVIHAHNTGGNSKYSVLKRITIRYCQRKLSSKKYMQFACSNEAAYYLFGGKNKNETVVLKNGINIERYNFDKEVRQKIRNIFGYKREQLIVGNVARFTPQKNHIFIISIFEKVLRIIPDARLMLVGDGPLKSQIEDMVRVKSLSDSVVFLGNRGDVAELLQAMDVFLLPSVYEGFGIVNVEAQCAGLPCIVSTEVPEMVRITELVQFLPLTESAETWATAVRCVVDLQTGRRGRGKELVEAGFDITSSALKLQKCYEKIGRL